jgi:hypothetical protein
MQANYTKTQKTQIYSTTGRAIGYVKGNTFYKTVAASRHFLRTPPAIAFDTCSLEAAQRAGAEKVIVKDKESGVSFRAQISYILEKGFPVNRGFGEQIALPLAGFIRSRPGDMVGEQLKLFGTI